MTVPAPRKEDLYASHAYKESSHCSRCGFRKDQKTTLGAAMHSLPYGDPLDRYAPHAFAPMDECARCGFGRANTGVHPA